MKTSHRNTLLAAAGLGALLLYRSAQRRKQAFDLKGRVVLITGGGRGLGLEIARQLAKEGAKLAICSRHENQQQIAEAELRSMGAEVLSISCDVTDQEQVQAMVRLIEAELGRVEVLINNAGIIQVGPLEEMQLREFDEAIKTHYYAPLYTMLAVLPHMRQRGEGRIVNISSVGGKVALPHQVPYSASKFALVGLSEGFRQELRQHGILVTTVCPGLVRTGSPRNVVVKGRNREEFAWFTTLDTHPLTSMSAETMAADIVDALRYGDADLTTTLSGKAISLLHGIAPGLTTDLMSWVNGFLPEPGGIGRHRVRGYDSYSEKIPGGVLQRDEEAAERNNE